MDALELWCWRRLLRVPWTARRSKQSILKEITPVLNIHWKDWCWSSNTLATWMWRADSLEKTLMLRHIEGRRRRGWQRIRWLDGITNSVDMSLSKIQEMEMGSLLCCIPWSCRVSHDWVNEQQSLPLHCSCGPLASPERSSGGDQEWGTPCSGGK